MTMFASRQPPPKKKRKSRTAFTNHQIFELEKRFLYQKYLSPADRDELAQALGLSNAQVITWFQNRRAKLKRDMEELKKDVESSKILKVHKAYLDNIQELGLSKIKLDKNSHELTLGKIKFNRECLLQHAERELHALRHPTVPQMNPSDLMEATKLNLL